MTAVQEQPTKKAKKKDAEPAAVSPAEAYELVQEESLPEPGDPDFDWQAEYIGEKVFTYTTDDDVTVGIAAISEKRQPSIGFMRETRRKPEFEQILDMVEIVASDTALTLIDDWNATQLVKMWAKWTEWNKTNAGE